MGNRAVITTPEKKIGVYVHWNGGRDSIEAFLTFCKLKGYRDPAEDCYGWSRLCQCIGNFFGEELSVGIDTLDHLDCDNYDNGVYIIKDWKVVGRDYSYHTNEFEQQRLDYARIKEMVEYINSRYVDDDRIKPALIDSYFAGMS